MRFLPLVLALPLVTACVPKKVHQELQADYAALESARHATWRENQALEIETDQLRDQVATLRARNERLGAFYDDLLDTFGDELADGTVQVLLYPDRMSLAFSDAIAFASGSDALSPRGADAVDRLAELLNRHPDRTFRIEGHTDSQPIVGDAFSSNWELGALRAVTVVEALVSEGVDSDQLVAASYAATEPVAPNGSALGRSTNRRVEVALQPSLDELPGHRRILWDANVVYATGTTDGRVVDNRR